MSAVNCQVETQVQDFKNCDCPCINHEVVIEAGEGWNSSQEEETVVCHDCEREATYFNGSYTRDRQYPRVIHWGNSKEVSSRHERSGFIEEEVWSE